MMNYVRTSTGSMLAVTAKSNSAITTKKPATSVKTIKSGNKTRSKKS